jgi:hypothetical protein
MFRKHCGADYYNMYSASRITFLLALACGSQSYERSFTTWYLDCQVGGCNRCNMCKGGASRFAEVPEKGVGFLDG